MKKDNSVKKKQGKTQKNEEKLMKAVPGFAHARDSLMQLNYTELKAKETPMVDSRTNSPNAPKRAPSPS
jgi:hypothetical protein